MTHPNPKHNRIRSRSPRVYLTEYTLILLAVAGITLLITSGPWDARIRYALIAVGLVTLPASFGLVAVHDGARQALDEWREFAEVLRKSLVSPAPTGVWWATFKFVGGLAIVLATPMFIWNEPAGWTTFGVAVFSAVIAIGFKAPDTLSKVVYAPIAALLMVSVILVGLYGAIAGDQWRVVVLTGIGYVLAFVVFWMIDRMAAPDPPSDPKRPEGGS